MFRTTIRLNESADAAKEAAALLGSAKRSGLEPASANLLATGFGEVLRSLVESGRMLKAQGSQINVTRKFEGKGYSVTLKFGAGTRPGIAKQIWRFFRGR